MSETIMSATVIERFLDRMAAQDLAGVAALYADDAVWEALVPGWDGVVSSAADRRELHESFFGRDHFAIERSQIVREGPQIALLWDLSWRDRQDAARCTSFQSHFFEIRHGRIQCHRMHCAGVRVAGDDEGGDAPRS